MATVKIDFSDHTVTPPVYIAGTFTDWQPVELESTPTQDEHGNEHHSYEKSFVLIPGTYQHKYRLGTGDWWVCDPQKPIAHDDAGNENNVLVVDATAAEVTSHDVSSIQTLPGHASDDLKHTSSCDSPSKDIDDHGHESRRPVDKDTVHQKHAGQKRDSGVDVSAIVNASAVQPTEKRREGSELVNNTGSLLGSSQQPGNVGDVQQTSNHVDQDGGPGPAIEIIQDSKNTSEPKAPATIIASGPNEPRAFSSNKVSARDVNGQQTKGKPAEHIYRENRTLPGQGKKISSGRSWLSNIWNGGSSSLVAIGAAVAVPIVLAYFLQK